ncbi:amidohydrolase family protein [Leucobacter sp. UT-8R-CII-1-4]|uniref:N-acyl-D-amino-acid deacylase family protein n=1 Tax=Leucobacter sp. UT-8R-CII-1-4 TaxID=3040075 RepID=UPI0024A7D74A|nr:amidohydrolase family protein [Leucobacter sp. UT-8R-CII-1-4]MDI6023416.1 amidohydrolase family protein [Leucobacter sp. UT-8R-CII-1-4]
MSTSSADRMVLIHGTVADGRGDAPYQADVVVSNGVVESVIPAAARPIGGYDAEVIDCAGQIVAPGFVDIHCHSDLSLLAYPENESRINQGVTTELVGNCGMSPAPFAGDMAGLASVVSTIDVVPELKWQWDDVAGWLNKLRDTPAASNVAAQIGHGSARFAVAGQSGRALSPRELDLLEEQLEIAFDAGCVGASVGLMYAPGEGASAEEIYRVAKVVAKHDGLLSAHLRDYRSTALIDSVNELAEPAHRAGARLQISHLRATGGSGFEDTLAHIERLRDEQDIAADSYPYVHGHTTAIQLLPSEIRMTGPAGVLEFLSDDLPAGARAFAASGYLPEQVIVMKASARPESVGLSLDQAAGDPWQHLAQLMLDCSGDVDVAVESGSWNDVDLAMKTPWISIASDGTALNESHQASVPHPRSWGAFPAAYRRMRSLGVDIGEAVRRLSEAPAKRMKMSALIEPGLRADLTVFDEQIFSSAATFAAPAQGALGLQHVLVAGAPVLLHGSRTGSRSGVFLSKTNGGVTTQ